MLNILINKDIARKIGLRNAILLTLLYSYRDEKGNTIFVSEKFIKEDSGLSTYAVKKGLKELQDLGLVIKKVLKTNYYSINESILEYYLISGLPSKN